MEPHLFCEECFDSEIRYRINVKKQNKHYYLFDWAPGESDLISAMVYQLKSDRCTQALEFYTQLLTPALTEKFDFVVPLPGSKKDSVHSLIMARKMASRLKVPILDLLIKSPSDQAQKKKSIEERSKTVLMLSRNNSPEDITTLIGPEAKILFVDDILTTGSTYNSALTALSREKQDSIATLFYRPSSQKCPPLSS